MDPLASDPHTERWERLLPLSQVGAPSALHLFIVGFEPVPESLSFAGGRNDLFLLEPVTAAAVEYEEGWVLLDTGFNVDIIRSPELRRQYFNFESYTAVIPPGDPLAERVEEAGLDWADLKLCAISHSHIDHTGGLRLVPAGTPIILQQAEWDYVSSLDGITGAVFPDEILCPERRIVCIRGDTKLAPGLRSLDTSGHTPGHQSFEIELGSKTIVLAFDAADLEQNISREVPCGWTIGDDGPQRATSAIQRLAAARALGADVWPGHDPKWWEERLAGANYLRIDAH